MTKKNVFFIALGGGILSILFGFLSDNGSCNQYQQMCQSFAFMLLIFLALLPLSILIFSVREKTFYSWLKFTYWWIPLSIFIIFLAPLHDGSLLTFSKQIISLWMSGLFIFISLIIIIKKSFGLRKADISKKIV